MKHIHKEIVLEFEDLPPESEFAKHLSPSDTLKVDCNEKYRPKYHFAPQYGWMNDPNGMFWYDGYYHLHFQYNPYAAVWGNMHWGHAVSKDLFKWDYLPFSLAPDELGAIFSGSSIVDTVGVSAFGKNSIVSFYTTADKYQQQAVAFSTDGGWNWEKYGGNPAIPSTLVDFRDPKVMKYNSTHYVMSLAVGQHVEFWGSTNLTGWEYLSSFGDGYGNHGGVWECPDLIYFEQENKYVLIVNINPGGYFGGSAAQYFVGDFDGVTFTCEQDPEEVLYVDHGKDAYAIVTWSNDPKGRNIGVAWMSNWDYANQVPTKFFRSSMSIPRKFGLKKVAGEYKLTSVPVEEASGLRGSEKSFKNEVVKADKPLELKNLIESSQTELRIEIDFTGTSDVFTVDLMNDVNQYVEITLDKSKSTLAVDRRASTD